MDRATASYAVGRRFNSGRGRQKTKGIRPHQSQNLPGLRQGVEAPFRALVVKAESKQSRRVNIEILANGGANKVKSGGLLMAFSCCLAAGIRLYKRAINLKRHLDLLVAI